MPARIGIFYQSNFETGAIQDPNDPVDGWFVNTIDPAHAAVVSDRSREGSHSVRLFIDRDLDYTSVNSGGEDKPRVNLGGNKFRFLYDTDYWVGMSVYLPSNWADDSANPETIMQLKQPVGGSPLYALRMNNGEWEIWNRWDDQSDTDAATTNFTELYVSSIAADKGKWTDWVMHFRLCPFPACDGLLEVWKDGVQIVNQTGPNTYLRDPEDKGPQVTLNIYKFNWKQNPSVVTTRELWFDAIRFGDATSNYASVAPGIP